MREGDSFAELPNLPSNVLLEVLSILQALEFADYSEKAKEKALEKLSSTIKELSRKDPTPENRTFIEAVICESMFSQIGQFMKAYFHKSYKL
ncbi:MAG: hypothetical protein PWQ95_82 [Thermococcaceae archaeon]|nr:hypothetical protein [Thermococcaceae archaeon]